MPAKIFDFNDEDFPQESTAEDRKKAFALIGISHDPKKTLEEKLAIKHDNSAMLGDDKAKKLTTADRIHTLFQQQSFSPLTRLLRLVKIEEAKLEAYHRAESYGMDPKLLVCLPKPDKKFYATLLLQLVKYEVPELKSIEVSGQVESGMTVNVVNHVVQQKIVKVDASSPKKLKELYDYTDKTLETVKRVAVEVVDDY